MTGLGDFVGPQTETLHLMSIEYEERWGEPIVHLWCRDENDKKVWVEVEGHKPSFYIHEDAASTRIKNHDWVTSVEAGYESIRGDSLVRIETQLPKHVGGGRDIGKPLRDYFERTWEADVFYGNRFLIDTGIETHFEVSMDDTYEPQSCRGDYRVHVDDISPVDDPNWRATPRVVTVDIEVLSPDGFPEAEDANYPVTAITAHDSHTDEYTVWVLRHEGWTHSDTEIRNLAIDNRPATVELDDGSITANVSDVRVFANEAQMLDDFNNYIGNAEPDMLGGWNSSATDNGDAFDYPYLIHRCQSCNVYSFDQWSPLEQVWTSRRGTGELRPGAKGVEFFDLLQSYKKTRWSKPKGGYSLENIADLELPLSEGKLEIDDIDTAWKEDPGTFLEYNIRDVQATVAIDRAAEVTELYQNIRALTGAQFGDCHNNIDLLDVFILRYAKRMDVALPTNTKPDRGWYYGACFTPDTEVMTPSGVVNICDLDVGDMVYSIDEDSGTVTPKPVTETIEYPEYDGEVVDIQSDHIDFRVTPNHEMIVQNDQSEVDNYFRRDAGELSEHTQYAMPREFDMEHGESEPIDLAKYVGQEFEVSDDELYNRFSHDTYDRYLDPEDAARIIGWFVAEGSVWETKVTITQEKHQQAVEDALNSAGINWSLSQGRNYQIYHKPLAEFLSIECGQSAEAKQLPEQVFDFSREHKQELLDTLCLGDGDIDRDRYNTVSERLRDDVLKLALHLGGQPRYSVREQDECRDKYVIYYGETQNLFSMSKNGRVSTVDNGVYCVEVADNHSLLAGRNGKFQFVGNCVFEPKLGRHENVVYPDLWSMYPNMIRNANMSPETLVGTEQDLADSEYDESDCRWTYVDTRPTHVKNPDGMDGARDPEYEKLYFLKPSVQTGFMTEVVDDLMGLKDAYDGTPLYDAVKRIVNSVYGVYGDSDSYNKGYRLFDWRIAEGITLGGRKMIQASADTFISELNDLKDERGYEGNNAYLVGGDTDSVMTSIPFIEADEQDDYEEIVDLSHDAAARVNEWYDEWTSEAFNLTDGEHYCELEIESYAPRAFVPEGVTKEKAKKRYAEVIAWDEGDWELGADSVPEWLREKHDGVLTEGDFSVTGIDVVRSDRAIATRETVQKVLEAILRVDDRNEAKTVVYEVLNETVNEIREGNKPLSYIARPKGMSKHPEEYGSTDKRPMPTYRGAKYAHEHFEWENLVHADKPRLLYIDRVHGDWPREYDAHTAEDGDAVDAIAVTDVSRVPDEFDIDTEKMIEKVLEDPLTPILSPLRWSFQDAIADTTQSDIGNFM
jgi:DNA polymerase elongation subunit (family B)